MAKIKVSKELLEALEELKETITNIIMAHQAIMLQLQQEVIHMQHRITELEKKLDDFAHLDWVQRKLKASFINLDSDV